jgi:hypothetical protein
VPEAAPPPVAATVIEVGPVPAVKPEPACEKPSEPEPPPQAVIPEMFGDQAPVSALLPLPLGVADRLQGPSGAARPGVILVPSARYFKISDNDSPRPQTRDYFSFNYFYNLDGAVNDLTGAGIRHTRIHREIWGIEWATSDGNSSIGLRLPLDTYNAANTIPSLDGTSTDIGDLSVIFKEVIWCDKESGDLVSAGLAVTPPTGPGSFAGSNNIKGFHVTTLQPFVGSVWTGGGWYLQHFTAVDAPTDLNDVVLLSNDMGVGYFLYQTHRPGCLTAIVPTVEVHVTTPLNHRGVLGLTDKAGTPDMVDITAGVNFEYADRSDLAVGFATPVTGPRMFDFEILAQVRCRY